MTIKELDELIAKCESGKKQVNIAQIKEIRKIISLLIFQNPLALGALIESGKKALKEMKDGKENTLARVTE